MTTAPSTGKICIVCGQDCSNKPRTKDPQGRYTCKSCLDAVQAKKAAAPRPAPKPAPEPVDDDAGVMAALLASSPAPDLTEACPACGSGLAPGAVLCTICGYNKQTGKTGKSGSGGSGLTGAALGAAASVGGKAASKLTFLILGAIGGAVGGAVGAAVWAGVAYAAHVELGWIAWGVGLATGVGVAMLSGKHAGPMTGLIAALIAVVSVFAGRYAAISMMVDSISHKVVSKMKHVTEDDCLAYLADEEVKAQAAQGKKLEWPKGMNAQEAHERGDYPADVWASVEETWQKMTPEARSDYRDKLDTYARGTVAATLEDVKSEGFIESFGLFDIVWVLLAVATAFRVGCSPLAPGGAGRKK